MKTFPSALPKDWPAGGLKSSTLFLGVFRFRVTRSDFPPNKDFWALAQFSRFSVKIQENLNRPQRR